MALEVLKMMDTGKRIVITPGMIELGDRQNDLNMELGRTIAHCADIAIIVGGIQQGGIGRRHPRRRHPPRR